MRGVPGAGRGRGRRARRRVVRRARQLPRQRVRGGGRHRRALRRSALRVARGGALVGGPRAHSLRRNPAWCRTKQQDADDSRASAARALSLEREETLSRGQAAHTFLHERVEHLSIRRLCTIDSLCSRYREKALLRSRAYPESSLSGLVDKAASPDLPSRLELLLRPRSLLLFADEFYELYVHVIAARAADEISESHTKTAGALVSSVCSGGEVVLESEDDVCPRFPNKDTRRLVRSSETNEKTPLSLLGAPDHTLPTHSGVMRTRPLFGQALRERPSGGRGQGRGTRLRRAFDAVVFSLLGRDS